MASTPYLAGQVLVAPVQLFASRIRGPVTLDVTAAPYTVVNLRRAPVGKRVPYIGSVRVPQGLGSPGVRSSMPGQHSPAVYAVGRERPGLAVCGIPVERFVVRYAHTKQLNVNVASSSVAHRTLGPALEF